MLMTPTGCFTLFVDIDGILVYTTAFLQNSNKSLSPSVLLYVG